MQQELFRLASFIATMFTDPIERRFYEEAAATIRLPYWDWALAAPPGQTHLPDVFWHPVIVQYGPRGTQTIRNPLYSYKFHPLEEEALIWQPVRCPRKGTDGY
jgi:tyrosinase